MSLQERAAEIRTNVGQRVGQAAVGITEALVRVSAATVLAASLGIAVRPGTARAEDGDCIVVERTYPQLEDTNGNNTPDPGEVIRTWLEYTYMCRNRTTWSAYKPIDWEVVPLPLAPVPLEPAPEAGACFPPARTTFNPREDAEINGIKVHADVRDLPSCIRPLFQTETGIDNPLTPQVEGAQNFKVRLPSGWSVVVSPTTVAVHREGGIQRDFTNGEVVVVNGPFAGGIGVYEGWLGLIPSEWATVVANERLALQRQQRPGAQLVTFQG